VLAWSRLTARVVRLRSAKACVCNRLKYPRSEAMHWIAPSEKETATETLEKRLWDAAAQFRPKKCGVRSPKCEAHSVRCSTFVIRHLRPLAVHGLEGDIRHAGNVNGYWDALHHRGR
jgi:hypothetical protein